MAASAPTLPSSDPEGYGWDWTATTHEARDLIVNDLLDAMGSVYALPGKGLQGWSQSVEGFDPGGHSVGRVYFGGGRDDVHVVATSVAAHETRSAVVGIGQARTSRVDTRVDTLVPYETLVERCWEAARSYRTKLTRMESFDGDGSSLGRTVYVGAPSSAIRVRIYEKWMESPGQYVDGTNRVEVQLRPPSKVKDRVSAWTPGETFCASRVTRDIARVLEKDVAEVGTLHLKRPTPTLEESLAAMGRQYGNAAEKFLAMHAGDATKLVGYLTGAVELEPVHH